MTRTCAGCGEKAGEFQCPLCQAAELDGGYFCGQECFAKSFTAHRDSVHPGGTVRAKRSSKRKEREDGEEASPAAAEKKEANRKRALDSKGPQTAAEADQQAVADADEEGNALEGAFENEEEEAVFKAALEKELQRRKDLPCWPVWGSVDDTGDGVAFVLKGKRDSALATRPVLVVEPAAPDAEPSSSAWARSDVAIASDDVPAHLHAASLFAARTASNWIEFGGVRRGERHVVIVTGTATSCHAVAWAARCIGVESVPVAATSGEWASESPDKLLASLPQGNAASRQVVIVSHPSLAASADASARVSAWLGAGPPQSRGLLITLPDLPCDPEDLQSLTAPSIFVRTPSTCPKPEPAAAATPAKKGGATPAKKPAGKRSAASAVVAADASVATGVPTIPAAPQAPALVAADHEPAKALYDGLLSAALVARGDLLAATNIAARLHSEARGAAEEALFATMMQDWGAPSAVYLHHRLAVLLRLLCDASVKLATSQAVRDASSLAHVAARCVVRAARHLPAIGEDDLKAANSPCPFIYLDATLTYCFSKIPKTAVDELAEAWGLKNLGVVASLSHADRLRTVALHRLRSRYQPVLGVMGATFAGVLHHMIADAAIRHSLVLRDVRAATLWDEIVAGQFGELPQFLGAAMLVHRPEDITSKSGHTRDGTKISKTQRNKINISDFSFVHDATAVMQHPTQNCGTVKRLTWPIRAARQRRKDLMIRVALEELLSAMPSSRTVPMYLGDIGNLIGKWTRFNSRFGGYLPPSLLQFLEMFPNEFRIVGNVVTRVKDSKTQQIKLRFDNDEYEDDSDDGGRKKKHRKEQAKRISLADIRTRRGLQAAEKRLLETKNMTKRAAKKKMRSLRNKARYNRNQKQLDTSARVPGYNKPKPKAIKGRGRKANARTIKRAKQ